MWYSASLLFKGVHKNKDQSPPLWEDSIRVFQGSNENEVREKAKALAKKLEVGYETTADHVEWRFDCIERVTLLDIESLADGAEIFSRFLRDSEVESLLTPFED